ncbi:GNAT family N-acetyltransferase [Pseudomonas protegens]|uniref:GNAT family N-acetyltransferase n=1 Tax=Pseudomonas protegens TaxID=380021 RepID=UPI00277858AE|nr:GNAT family N-acetyltransferase [Pseudomonas protegens]MDP9528416.1 GNAT family N-acetyltransferase [Pseudomonas protegens]
MTIQIRRARVADAAFLPAIETSAAELFRSDPQLAWLADAEVADAQSQRDNIRRHPVWVALTADGTRCAFLNAQICDRELHVWEISVATGHQGQGIGKRLLQAAREFALEQQLTALTLSTFRELPWNEPFYQRQGFVTLQPAQLSSRLRQVLADETQHGLPAARRCAMRLTL